MTTPAKIPSIRLASLCILAALALSTPAQSEDAAIPLMRISTENTNLHVQTRIIDHFLEVLGRRTAGTLHTAFYHSARLYRDSDAIKALQEGKIEMAVLGTWQIDPYEPNVGIIYLPEIGRASCRERVLRLV